MNIYTIIITEFLLLSSSILLLFRLRARLGLAPHYILLGAVQYLQANLGSSLSFIFFDDYLIYHGSIILFSGVLFTVLLIYIKEGVASARALMLVSLYPFNNVSSLNNTVSFLQPQAQTKGLSMVLEISEKEINLISDERRVEQILLNLLSNAIKFLNKEKY
ncbi:sensor histidine kinase [Hwangdonia seohaensis]|uniref:Sensor histidine kinase n=1 Tax=Hwangdonia seohaensis TaxID=1240727 RepID=A0ABW3R7I1_9FLAO|nr:hypothetical protein [Hwangdonia seohaensis]